MGNCCGGSNVIYGSNQPKILGGSKLTSRVLKNPDLWYERAMLYPHESIRRLMMSLQKIYQYEHLGPQWKRKLLSQCYKTYFYDIVNEHHDLEEQVFIPWLKTKVNEVKDITTVAHDKLLKDLIHFKTHFETLANKKSITVKDIDIKNLINFFEFMNNHLDQEEEYWVPLIRDNFSEEEHDQLVGQIMQKATKIEALLVVVIEALKEWASIEVYEEFFNHLPPPVQQAYPKFFEVYDQTFIRTVSLICSGMEKEPVGYIQPGPTKITSRIIKNPKEWYENTLLNPHEFIRRLMFNLQEMHILQNLQLAWKRKLISRWYNDVFCVLVHEHHDAEEKILQPLLKQKFPTLKDITSEPHNKLLKQITNFQIYFENLAKKVSITQKDIDIKGLNTFVDFMMLHLDQEEEYWPKIIKDNMTEQDVHQITGKIIQSAQKPDLITAVFIESKREWETPESFAIFTTKALPLPVQQQLPLWIEGYNNNQRRWYRLIISNTVEEPEDLKTKQENQ